MIDDTIIPEGKGFEIDYDWYEKKPHRKYKTAQDWWEKFANNRAEKWAGFKYQDELLKLVNGDTHLAIVISYFIGEEFSTWMYKKDISSLGGLSPIECKETPWGIKRLRMHFMQPSVY